LPGRAVCRIAIVSGKIILPLCLIVAIGCGVLYLLAPWLVSQRMGKFDPRLSIVPADLPTKVEAPLSNASIDCFGFTVRLPNEVDKTFRSDPTMSAHLQNGGLLVSQNMSQGFDLLGYKISEKHTQEMLGKELVRSKFNLMQRRC
jgi:hypothetical protein